MEISNIKEQGEYTVIADLAETEDMQSSSSWVIRPDKLILLFTWSEGKPWRLYQATVSGQRVIKGGRLGQDRSSKQWWIGLRGDRDGLPDWLRQFAAAHRPTDRDALDADRG